MGSPQKPNSPAATLPASVQALEQHAREFLASGRYRKARDEIKVLCKIDRPRYLPLLIEANQGLAREMLAKGQVSEAQQVLVYLRTIASPAQMRALELELAGKAGDWDTIASHCVPLLADAGVPLTPREKQRLADQTVLAFRTVPALNPSAAQVASQVHAIHQALQAVAELQWERALAAVRPIPHNSMFSAWKLFVKGLAAFHSGEVEKAVRLFAELPEDSVPDKASQPYRVLAGQVGSARPQLPVSAPVVEAICRLVGQPSLGPVLVRADRLWKDQFYADSYEVLRKAISAFPSESLDGIGVLSEFYFNALFTLPEADQDDYVYYLQDLGEFHASKSRTELEMAMRSVSLFLEPELDPLSLRMSWELFVRVHQELHGPNPRLASIAYGWLGAALARTSSPSIFFFHSKPSLRDPEGAIQALQKSVELDPTNLQAHLTLCHVFDQLKKTSDRNRLLDLMTRRFPDNKAVLLQAGRGCLDRNALLKGLEYLEHARQLDLLDSAIANLLVYARLKLAQQCFLKGRNAPARKSLDHCRELLLDDPANLVRSHWAFRVRNGLLEQFYGDKAIGDELLGQARATSPCPAAFLLFAQLAHRVYAPGDTKAMPFAGELAAACKNNACAADALTLLRIYFYWTTSPDCPILGQEEYLLQRYLKTAAKHPFTRDEVRALIDLTGPESFFSDEVELFIDKVLAKDPKDPLFRLYRFSWDLPLSLNNSDRPEIQSIIDEAVRRGDEQSVQIARQLLARLGAPTPFRPPLLPPPVPEEEIESDDFEGIDPEEQRAGLAENPQFQETIALLAAMSHAEIEEFRKSLRGEIPDFLFDMLVDIARGRGPGSSIRPPTPQPANTPRPRPAAVPPPESDPNQLTLF